MENRKKDDVRDPVPLVPVLIDTVLHLNLECMILIHFDSQCLEIT